MRAPVHTSTEADLIGVHTLVAFPGRRGGASCELTAGCGSPLPDLLSALGGRRGGRRGAGKGELVARCGGDREGGKMDN